MTWRPDWLRPSYHQRGFVRKLERRVVPLSLPESPLVWAVPSTALRAGIRARCEGRVLDGRQPMGVEAAAWQAYSINRIVPALAIEGFDTMRAKRVY
jgi:hypothetical protein